MADPSARKLCISKVLSMQCRPFSLSLLHSSEPRSVHVGLAGLSACNTLSLQGLKQKERMSLHGTYITEC